MKRATIDADTYGDVVYKAVAIVSPKDMAETRLAARVLTKLEEKGVPQPPESLSCPNCRHQITPPSSRGGFQLVAEEMEFEFEDQEAEFLVKRIEEYVPRLQSWAAVQAVPVVDQLTTAPTY